MNQRVIYFSLVFLITGGRFSKHKSVIPNLLTENPFEHLVYFIGLSVLLIVADCVCLLKFIP